MYLQKMPAGRPKRKFKQSGNSEISPKLGKTDRRKALDKARHSENKYGHQQGLGEQGQGDNEQGEQGSSEGGKSEQGDSEQGSSEGGRSEQGNSEQGKSEQGSSEQSRSEEGGSESVLRCRGEQEQSKQGRGEERGEKEQQLQYSEGKSDSEIELPDSEYDEDTVTLEELVSDVGKDELLEQERISRLRRDARNKQWENKSKKEQKKTEIKEEKKASLPEGSEKKSPPSSFKISSWKKEMKMLLPTCFEQQLDMLGIVLKSFPESSSIRCEKPGLSGREGKSEFYRKFKILQQFLEPIPAKAELLLCWASDLAVIDYEKFKDHGLSFSVESDIPVSVLIWEKSERIKAEVWGNYRREDVRRLTLDHMIRVYKVSAYSGVCLKVTIGLLVTSEE